MTGTPDLSRDVSGLGDPVPGGEESLLSVEEDETFGKVGVFVGILVRSGKWTDTSAGLSPVCLRCF